MMRIVTILSLTCSLAFGIVSASAQRPSAAGVWEGSISTPGAGLRVIVTLQPKDDRSWSGAIDIPMQNAKAIPLIKIAIDGASVAFSLPGVPGDPTFTGKLSDDGETISGDFTQGPGKFPFKLERSKTGQGIVPGRPQEPKKPFPYDEREVTYENRAAGIKLAGTLTLPRSGGPFPAVILISGSGPQDRDENIAGHKPFLILADHLTRRGIAVLRVDDRGMGGSTGSTMASTDEDVAGDVLSGISFLKGLPEIDVKHIGLIGHSEGGLVAPLAAVKSTDVAFTVLMAAPGLPGDQIMYLQAAAMMKASGMADALIAQNRKLQQTMINIVKSEKDPAVRLSRFRSVRTELVDDVPTEMKGSTMQQLEAQFQQVSSPAVSYLINTDPRSILAKLKCPVLALNGEKDLQVLYRENLAGIEEALESGGNMDYTIKILPNLNHLFQTSKTGLPSEYSEIEETMSPDALNTISDWIGKHVRSSRR
jgi:pimeloyl-ACP methyl ester carboxylesterase